MTSAGAGTPTPPDPLVVVVAYHAADLLDRCLAGLGGAFDVRVVDNSSDPEVAAVADRHGAAVTTPGRNLGFAGGVNAGCAAHDGRDVLLLNPDAVITPGAVRRLHARLAADPLLAAVAPAQHDPDAREEARVLWPFPTPGGAWLEAVGLGRLRRGPGFLIGSVLLVSDRALHDVGAFDDRFFLYAEETDWQRRAADRGWRVALCPEVVASHVGAGTGGDPTGRETHFQASHERYVRTHHGTVGWWSYRLAALCGFGGGPSSCPAGGARGGAAVPARGAGAAPGRGGPGRHRAARDPRGRDRQFRRCRAVRLPGGQRAGRPGSPGRRHRWRARTDAVRARPGRVPPPGGRPGGGARALLGAPAATWSTCT